MFPCSLIAVCQNCWALIMSRFSKIQLLPHSWILPSIRSLLLSESCCLLLWGVPKLFFLEQLNEHFELWLLFTLGGQGHESLQVVVSFPKIGERGRVSVSHPTILSAGRSNKFSQPLETSHYESCISASCPEPNVIFVEACCDSRSVTCQSDQNEESLRGLQGRKNELSIQKPFACKLPPSRFLFQVSWLFAFTPPKTNGDVESHFLYRNSQHSGLRWVRLM